MIKRLIPIIFLTIILFTIGCSSLKLSSQTETKPAVTAPVSTVEPTKTVKPTEIPDPRFKELLPETLAKCMEENVINWDTRDADLAVLIKKIKERSPNPGKGDYFASEIVENLPKDLRTNDFVDLWMQDSIFIDACAGLKHPSGKIYPVFVLPLLRFPDKTTIDYLSIAFPMPLESFYQDLKQERFSSLAFGIDLERGKRPETAGKDKNTLDLIPTNKSELAIYRQNLRDYFAKDHTVFSEEKMNMLRSFINGTIFALGGSIVTT